MRNPTTGMTNTVKRMVTLVLFVPFLLGNQSPEPKDYRRFTHKSHTGVIKIPGTAMTREMKCDACHDRSALRTAVVGNTARNEKLGLSFPGHRACVECHINQFTQRPMALCAICHNDSQGLTNRPPQREFPERYDFNVFFDGKQHDAHLTYRFADGPSLDCATCHKPTQKQTARLIPSHPECYSCHSPSSQDEKARQKSACVVCHTLPVDRVEPRDYRSLAYGARFTHQTHVGYAGNNCTVCHTVTGGYSRPGAAPSSLRVKQHSSVGERSGRGCFSCHDGGSHYGRTAFGEQSPGACVKCHGDEVKVFAAPG